MVDVCFEMNEKMIELAEKSAHDKFNISQIIGTIDFI